MNILANLEKQNKPFLVFAGFIFIGVIGFIDYLTGSDFSFSVFYILPISLITWTTNQRLGLVASVVSAIVWLVADVTTSHPHSFTFISFWNSFIRLAFFVIITLLLSSLKKSLKLAHTDFLTSALNSRSFYELVQVEMDRLQRYKHPFTIAYIDLDNFKSINDQLGHKTGDEVLITLVNSMTKIIRKSDFIARLGGDEFAVLFPETNQESAQIIFAKIQGSFVEAVQKKDWSITFSVGVLTCTVAPNTIHELMEMADKLMYLAKANGKNTVKYSTYAG